MTQKLFLKIVGVIAAVKAVFGIVYLIYGWKVWIATWLIPTWLVLVAVVVCALIAYWAFKFSKGRK